MSTRALHGLLSAIGILFFLLSLTNARPVIEERTVGRRPCVNDTNLPPAVRSVCPGGTSPASITNTTVLPSGVSMTTGVCHHDGGDQWEPATVDLAAVVDSPSCPIAPNDCVSRFGTANQGQGFVGECGAPCSSSCYQGTGGPDPNDCQHIANALFAQSPQLFVLYPFNFVLLSYNSCGTGIQNQIAAASISGCSQTMIYDYTDWAGIAQYLAWTCQAFVGANGGKCTANAGLYQPYTNDFYVQVYANN